METRPNWPTALQKARAALFLLFMTCALGADAAIEAEEWGVALLPASINADKTVHVVAGHAQPVFLVFQASESVCKRASEHDVNLTLSLPAGVELLDYAGVCKKRGESSMRTEGRRSLWSVPLRISTSVICGKPGSAVRTEWKTEALYLKIPDSLPKGGQHIEVSLESNGAKAAGRWELRLHSFPPSDPARPLQTRIGLWAYSFPNSGEASSPGLASFLQAAGVNHVQKVSEKLRPFLRDKGIMNGGDIHHGFFRNPRCPDPDINGKVDDGFACPTCTAELYKDNPSDIPGVRKMVEAASASPDKTVTFDYEPMGPFSGFCPRAVEGFKREKNVSDEQFERLRQHILKHGRQTYLTDNPAILALYTLWVSWRTKQTSAYVSMITDGFYRLMPGGRVELTPNEGCDNNSMTTLGFGYNAAEFARHVDVIQPQIYHGYGGAEAKLVMLQTRRWRQSLDAAQARAQLHPILLVRHSGASVFNNPKRVAQQIIGVVAEGAQGILLYYPDLMDAPYWLQTSDTARLLGRFENFYHKGKRVDEQFPAVEMPRGATGVKRFPGHEMLVENPQWHLTAHRLENRVLLTMFGLESANDVQFKIMIPPGWRIVEQVGAAPAAAGEWLVPPQGVGFVVLECD